MPSHPKQNEDRCKLLVLSEEAFFFPPINEGTTVQKLENFPPTPDHFPGTDWSITWQVADKL